MITRLADIAAWLCVIVLVGLGLWKLSIYLRSAIKLKTINLRRIMTGAGLSIFVVIVLVFIVPYLVSKNFDLTTQEAKFWLQTFAGNWSPDSFPFPKKPSEDTLPPEKIEAWDAYWFGVSASIAFWLNNAIILIFVSFAWRITKMARDTSIAAAIVLRDSFAKRAAKRLVRERFAPQQRDDIMAVFTEALTEGQKSLEKHLPNIDDNGQQIVDLLTDPRQQNDEPVPG